MHGQIKELMIFQIQFYRLIFGIAMGIPIINIHTYILPMNQDSIDVERANFNLICNYQVDKSDGVQTDDTCADLSDQEATIIAGTTLEFAGEEFEVQKEIYTRKGCKVFRMKGEKDHQILISKITDLPENNSSASIHLTYEIQFYKKLKTPSDSHLITIKNTISTRKQFVRLMEYACRGDLTQYIPSTTQNSTKLQKTGHLSLVKNILWQCLKGIEEIHNLGHVYRDLKPSNVLVDHNGAVKICDFGLVIPVGTVDTSICGTPEYMPPERLSNKRMNSPIDTSVDFWSLGVLAYELIMGYTPYYYEDDNIQQLLESMYGGYISFDEDLPSQCRHFIFNLLQTNPSKRMKLEQIKTHNFFKDFQQTPLISQGCRCKTKSSRS